VNRWFTSGVFAIVGMLGVALPSPAKTVFIEAYEGNSLKEWQLGRRHSLDAWNLGMIDGNLGFLGKWQGEESQKKLPGIPHDKGMMREAFRFLRSGDTLQIEVTPEEQDRSKIQAEKHRWYLTAKYADKDGKVTLTKEATKLSHWEFIRDKENPGVDVEHYYIKNVNDLGKDAWLGSQKEGVRYVGHQEIRKPKISFDEKQVFGIENVEDLSK
jgi:hypothetical protein